MVRRASRPAAITGEIVEGRFELEHVAGAGGMGTVYGARDRISGAKVALKLMHADGSSMRFAPQAIRGSDDRDPGILGSPARGSVPREGDGEDLSSRLRRGARGAPEAIGSVRGGRRRSPR